MMLLHCPDSAVGAWANLLAADASPIADVDFRMTRPAGESVWKQKHFY